MRHRRAWVGLAVLAALMLIGAALVGRAASNSIVRTIDLSAVAVAMEDRAGLVVVAGSDHYRGRVSVLDARTGMILRAVALTGAVTPGGEFTPFSLLALDDRAGRAFITTYNFRNGVTVKGYVNVLDTRRGTLLRTLTSKIPPVALAVDERAGRAFVTSQHTDRLGNPIGPGRVRVLDALSGRVLRTVAVSQNPYRSVVAARSRRVFVLSYSDQAPYNGRVAMLDPQTGHVLRTAVLGSMPGAVSPDEVRGRVFIMNRGYGPATGSISVLNAHTGAVMRAIGLQDEPVSMAIDTRYGHVFVATEHRDSTGNYVGPGRVVMLDARSGQILGTAAVGNYPTAIAVDAHSARVLVATVGPVDPLLQNMPMESGSVSVLDARSGRVLQTVPVGVAPSAIAVDERVGRAYVLNAGGSIEDEGGPDPWSWLPGWLRRRLPFLHKHAPHVRTVAGNLSVIDTTR